MVRDKNENDEYDSKYWMLTVSSIFHVSDTFSRILTIHHSTQQRTENRSINLSFLNIFEVVLKVITPSRPGLVSAIFHKTPSRRCSVHQSCTSQMPSRAYTFYHSTPQRAETLSINVECLRHSPQHWKRLPSKRPKARFSENTCLRQLHTFTY